MGNQQCRTNDDEKAEVPPSTDKVKARYKSTLKSTHDSSSFDRAVDPRDQFRRDIQKQCNLGLLPPLCMQHRFVFFTWESGIGLGHDSVVVGSAETEGAKYGYFTIELVVDESQSLPTPTVVPTTRFLARSDGDEKIEASKWKKQFELDSTIDQLIEFALALIDKHGTYSSFHNGCQQYVRDFLHKINNKEWSVQLKEALATNDSYQSALNSRIPGSSCVRHYRESKIKDNVRKEVGVARYQTAEETAIGIGTLLIVPAAAIAASKAAIDDNERGQVEWEPSGKVPVIEEKDESSSGPSVEESVGN